VNKIVYITLLFFYCRTHHCFCSNKTDANRTLSNDIDPLTPAKAASTLGLGQAYKVLEIPLVYGAIGTSLFYLDNNKNTINIEMLINAGWKDIAMTITHTLTGQNSINETAIYPHFLLHFMP
jgi:hypothetical protein